jgi:hypothetical protein
MNSKVKTEKCNKFCIGCQEYTNKLIDEHGFLLCEECNEIYYDSTDNCSLSCCLGGNCDQSC